jgi:DNA (cytosine-5)-methyltransferase 1
MDELRELSLFSGYGGFGLGLRIAGINSRTVGWCDNDKYIQKVIQARITDGYLDDAPIISDIRSFNWGLYRGLADIITAGFPCQPHSHAGKRKGAADERNLWPDTRRCISEVRPQYVLLENVPGILSNGYGGVVAGELSELGYDAQWGLVSATDIGASHLRKRWWCFAWLADSECEGLQGQSGDSENEERTLHPSIEHNKDGVRSTARRSSEQLADPRSERGSSGKILQYYERETPQGRETSASQPSSPYAVYSTTIWPPKPSDTSGWEQVLRERPDLAPAITKEAERQFRGVDDGPTHRVDRLKACGNGIVPAVVAEFLRRISTAQ